MTAALWVIAAALWRRELRRLYGTAWRWTFDRWLQLGCWIEHKRCWRAYRRGELAVNAEDIKAVRYFDGIAELDIASPEVRPDDPWCTTPGAWRDPGPIPSTPGYVGQEDEPVWHKPGCRAHIPGIACNCVEPEPLSVRRPKRKRRPKPGSK